MHRISKFFNAFFFFIFIGVSWAACKGKTAENKPRDSPPTPVDVIIASLQPVTNIVEANGTVIANESVELRPEVSGRLIYLNVPEGKRVPQGTVLARINSADLEAQVQKSRVQLDLQEKTAERLKKLLDVQGINQSDYDAVVNQVNSLKADIAYTQTLIAKTVIRAPFSGTIGLRQVSPGAYVSPATSIAIIQQLGKSKVDFTLPEQYSAMINVGGTVEVDVDAADSNRQRARIIAMEPQANTQTRNIVVRALLDKGSYNPGAFVKVYVGASGNGKKAIMVPTNSIISEDRNNQLILVKKGKASFVDVQTGLRLEGTVEIINGVKPGDTVVVTGVLFARPNLPVRVRSVKNLDKL